MHWDSRPWARKSSGDDQDNGTRLIGCKELFEVIVARTEGEGSLDKGAGVKLAGVATTIVDVCICDVRAKYSKMVMSRIPELKQEGVDTWTPPRGLLPGLEFPSHERKETHYKLTKKVR